MNRKYTGRSHVAALAVVVIAACGYDSTQPYGTPGQGTPPPDTSVAANPALGGLWTASAADPALLRLSVSQLTGSSGVTPASTITTARAALIGMNSIAFDDAGTLWVASESDNLLLGFGADRVDSTGLSSPTTVLASIDSSIAGPSSIAFDRQHRLWVANEARGTIVRFDVSQLAASGQPEPAVTIEGIGHPTSIAFDAAGALWMSDNQANRLFKFRAESLTVSGSPGPDVVITAGPAFSIKSPVGLAFDADGKLWVANPGRGNVIAYDVTQQTTGGPVVPSVSIALGSSGVATPVGLAFDSTRALWVVGVDGSLAKLDRASLAASGQPAASAALRLTGHTLFWSAAFWPKVKGLPLN